jgi:hypothetical protein
MGILPLPSDQTAFGDIASGRPTTVFYTWLKSFATTALALFNGTGPAWTDYAVTIFADSGSITTYTSAGRFYQLGKVIFLHLEIDITDAGTGGSTLNVTFPPTLPLPKSTDNNLAGHEQNGDTAIFGELLNDLTMRTRKFDNSTVVATGNVLIYDGTYEAA